LSRNLPLAYLLITSPIKHILIPFLLFIAPSICHASSDITFSGGGYEISVLLSDEECKVVVLNGSDDNPNIISIGTNELAALSKAESDCEKKQFISWSPKRRLIPTSN